jgi:hypothetical protein
VTALRAQSGNAQGTLIDRAVSPALFPRGYWCSARRGGDNLGCETDDLFRAVNRDAGASVGSHNAPERAR